MPCTTSPGPGAVTRCGASPTQAQTAPGTHARPGRRRCAVARARLCRLRGSEPHAWCAVFVPDLRPPTPTSGHSRSAPRTPTASPCHRRFPRLGVPGRSPVGATRPTPRSRGVRRPAAPGSPTTPARWSCASAADHGPRNAGPGPPTTAPSASHSTSLHRSTGHFGRLELRDLDERRRPLPGRRRGRRARDLGPRQVQVDDAGPDGVPDTTRNTVFAAQGVFVP